MKIPCELIHDLLILYDDDACSEFTRKVVEEHLKECENCRKHTASTMFPVKEEVADVSEATMVKRSFKKVRNRWLAAFLTILMLFPLTGIGVLGYNEAAGKGKALTNWDEIRTGEEFLTLVGEGKYEKAAELTSFHEEYEYLLEEQALTPEEYVEREMSQYQPITLGGEDMIWNADTMNALYSEYIDENGEVDWHTLILEDWIYAYYPETFFLEVMGDVALTETEDGEEVYTVEKKGRDILYHRAETKWGTYCLGPSVWENYQHLLENSKTDLNYLDGYQVIPKKLYDSAYPEEEAYLLQHYESNQETCHSLLDEGEDAFCSKISTYYAEKLSSLDSDESNKFVFKDVEFDSVRRDEGDWVVTYRVTFDSYNSLSLKPGTYTMTIDLKGRDGKIRYAGYGYEVVGSGRAHQISEILELEYYDMQGDLHYYILNASPLL